MQKMLLVGGLSVFEAGTPAQLLAAFLICAAIMLIVTRTAPYEEGSLDVMSFLSSMSITLTLFVGFTITIDSLDRRPRWYIPEIDSGIILIIVNALPFAYAVCITLARLFIKRKAMVIHLKKKSARTMRRLKTNVVPIGEKSEERAKAAWNISQDSPGAPSPPAGRPPDH